MKNMINGGKIMTQLSAQKRVENVPKSTVNKGLLIFFCYCL
jgi:hypothetical protein